MSRSQKETRAKGRYFFMALTASFMLFLSVGGLFWINEAQALRISMKRVIFEGPKRSDIITIMNNTAKEQTYRLGFRRYRMDERKSLVRIDEDDSSGDNLKWADDMIRYAPRRVTVPPGGSQQIRVLLRRPRDLAPGEYRSHLWIITETPAEDFAPGEDVQTGGQAFKLTMQPALTLPVFVRHGEMTAKAKITDAKLERIEGGLAASIVLQREGNRSLYGDLKIVCTGGGGEFVAHLIRGIAVYTEVTRRYMDFEFDVAPENLNKCSSARIDYVADRGDVMFEGGLMASARFGG